MTNQPDITQHLSLYRGHEYPVQVISVLLAQGGITWWGKYRQALREINTRFGGLRERWLQREQLLADVAMLSDRIGSLPEEHPERAKMIASIGIKRMTVVDISRSICELELHLRTLIGACDALSDEGKKLPAYASAMQELDEREEIGKQLAGAAYECRHRGCISADRHSYFISLPDVLRKRYEEFGFEEGFPLEELAVEHLSGIRDAVDKLRDPLPDVHPIALEGLELFKAIEMSYAHMEEQVLPSPETAEQLA